MVSLVKVTPNDSDFIYQLMKERSTIKEAYQPNDIPTLAQHEKFVKENDYQAWYVIVFDGVRVGTATLKKDGEWGYQVLKKHHGQGIGYSAARKLFENHPQTQFWARCKVTNKRAQHLLKKLGFKITIMDDNVIKWELNTTL